MRQEKKRKMLTGLWKMNEQAWGRDLFPTKSGLILAGKGKIFKDHQVLEKGKKCLAAVIQGANGVSGRNWLSGAIADADLQQTECLPRL